MLFCLRFATATETPCPGPGQALEPYISEEIMRLHHTAHHQAYVNGLNAAEEAYKAAKSTREQIGLQRAIKFNGGGAAPPPPFLFRRPPPLPPRSRAPTNQTPFLRVLRCSGHINHSLFWKNL